ncbi:MAG TPA: hypothetical protein VMV69_19265 [Pirellulales bacterium]|nr:hypothetical protein [Pirellulales bacterium]
MTRPIWLYGKLAEHARGDILRQALGSPAVGPQTVARLPDDHGLLMAFGQDFQTASDEDQRAWLRWTEPAGRATLLVPPLVLKDTALPMPWRAFRPQGAVGMAVDNPPQGLVDKLPKRLAAEVRFELTGELQVATQLGGQQLGGQWKNGGIHTAYYRKHPHAGVFAITCLPLWSLVVLDHKDELRDWAAALAMMAGEPAPAEEARRPREAFEPNKDHFAMMLHLCEREFADRDEALAALIESEIFVLPRPVAEARIAELEQAGLIANGRLTGEGRAKLFAGPYANYAEAIERSRP